jgi:hypothetical protein
VRCLDAKTASLSLVVSRSTAGNLSIVHYDLACRAHGSPVGRAPALDDLDDICAIADIVDRAGNLYLPHLKARRLGPPWSGVKLGREAPSMSQDRECSRCGYEAYGADCDGSTGYQYRKKSSPLDPRASLIICSVMPWPCPRSTRSRPPSVGRLISATISERCGDRLAARSAWRRGHRLPSTSGRMRGHIDAGSAWKFRAHVACAGAVTSTAR